MNLERSDRRLTPIVRNHATELLLVAAWFAVVSGILEGTILCGTRAFPAVLAAHKTSVAILWVAPLVNLGLFLLVGGALTVVGRLGPRWRLTYGALTFLGAFAILFAPGVLHPVSVVLLSCGIAAVTVRLLRGHEEAFATSLKRRAPWMAVIMFVAVVVAVGHEHGKELLLARAMPSAPKDAPNVVIIVLDTVRRDSVGRPDLPLTPRIDRLTKLGVSFDNAWATSSWSLPTQASILTGRYPHEHGADWPRLALSAPTLAEYFAQRGYVTGAFSGNAAWITPEYLDRGFIRFQVYRVEDFLRRTSYGRIVDVLLRGVGLHSAGRGRKAAEVNAGFADFIEDHAGRPFFAYLCYMDVNQAFHHRRLNRAFWQRSATNREVLDAYDEGLRAVDAEVGNLLDDLERRGLLERTLIVLTSDHGESFGATDTDDHDPPGHGTSLYAEQTRVPLSIVYAPKVPAGRHIERTVSQHDIPATILRVLDLADSPFGGQPLLDTVDDGDRRRPRPVLATLHYEERRMQSVIWDRWQYIRDLRRGADGEELFDLVADPHATRSMSSAYADGALPTSRLMLDELLRDPHRHRTGRERASMPSVPPPNAVRAPRKGQSFEPVSPAR